MADKGDVRKWVSYLYCLFKRPVTSRGDSSRAFPRFRRMSFHIPSKVEPKACSREANWVCIPARVSCELVWTRFIDTGSRPLMPSMKLAAGNHTPQKEVRLENCRWDLKTELLRLCAIGGLKDAIQVLVKMDQQGINVSVECYGHLLECCGTRLALAEAKLVDGELVKDGFGSNSYLSNLVLTTFVKCGSLADAVRVFNRLPERTAFSWTAILTAYIREGQEAEALKMYRRMEEEAVVPNKYTLVKLLKACGNLVELEQGRRVHTAAVKLGYIDDLFVGNSVVRMYAKCGSMREARDVFDAMRSRDVATWNAVITGYSQQGDSEGALELFGLMEQEGAGVVPDGRTFVSVVKSCASLAAVDKGTMVDGKLVKSGCLRRAKQIHSDIVRRGLDGDLFIGASLVTLYANCGSMIDALRVFEKLPDRDVVLWTAMISGYAQEAHGDKALEMYEAMQQAGVKPNNRTFVGVLKACGSQAARVLEATTVVVPPHEGGDVRVRFLEKARTIHADIVKSGYHRNQFVCNTLMDVYASCGSLWDARGVFDSLVERDVVSWNVMIAGYAQQGMGEEALKLFDFIMGEGGAMVIPNSRTFVSALQACCSLVDLEGGAVSDEERNRMKVRALTRGKQVHNTVIAAGLEFDVFVANAMVSMYARCGSMRDARKVFESLREERDVVSWNTMIAGYAQAKEDGGDEAAAVELYGLMLSAHGVAPDSWTFVSVLKACGSLAAWEQQVVRSDGHGWVKPCSLRRVKEIHAEVLRTGYEDQLFICNTLVDLYAKCGDLAESRVVFDSMRERNVVSWTAMIGACALHGQGEEGLQLYSEMRAAAGGASAGLKADDATLVCVLRACSATGSLRVCREVHDDLKKAAAAAMDRRWCSAKVATSLIHAYGKCGSMVDAQRVLDELSLAGAADVFSWTALMAGYARHGQWEMSFRCLEQMVDAGVKPEGVTFLCVIAACSHAGLVERGLGYLVSMRSEHGVRPGVEHYVGVVDLLGRAGQVRRAEQLACTMPVEASLTLWLCLLGACQKHKDTEVGERAFERAVAVEGKADAAYVLMANIYANANMWEEAQAVEERRRRACAWKKPGMSWIEKGGSVHTFLVGDRSHPDYQVVRGKVKALSDEMWYGMERSRGVVADRLGS